MNRLIDAMPLIGLLLFFSIFVLILVLVLRPGAKKRLEKLGQIPLEEDTNDRPE